MEKTKKKEHPRCRPAPHVEHRRMKRRRCCEPKSHKGVTDRLACALAILHLLAGARGFVRLVITMPDRRAFDAIELPEDDVVFVLQGGPVPVAVKRYSGPEAQITIVGPALGCPEVDPKVAEPGE